MKVDEEKAERYKFFFLDDFFSRKKDLKLLNAFFDNYLWFFLKRCM